MIAQTMKFLAVSALFIAAAVSLGAGDAPKKVFKFSSPLRLAFVTNNASDFWKIAAAGVRKYEGEAHVHVDFKMPPTGTVSEQKQILENLVSQGYNGIAVSVIAPDDETTEINKAAKH